MYQTLYMVIFKNEACSVYLPFLSVGRIVKFAYTNNE